MVHSIVTASMHLRTHTFELDLPVLLVFVKDPIKCTNQCQLQGQYDTSITSIISRQCTVLAADDEPQKVLDGIL